MVELRRARIANFNCTFGKRHEPMLNYLDSVVLPAFESDIEYKWREDKFLFKHVSISRSSERFYLTGLIVRRTHLKVKTLLVENELVAVNGEYPSDPFSYFAINLENHRMVLVQNQPGSPSLHNFQRLARYALRMFVTKQNEVLEKNAENKDTDTSLNTHSTEERGEIAVLQGLPKAHLNVVPLSYKTKIKDELEKVKKIKTLTLRFYPLNSEIIGDEAQDEILNSLDKVSSPSARLVYNSPRDIQAVGELINDTQGRIDPTLEVEFEGGAAGRLSADEFNESLRFQVNENAGREANLEHIIHSAENRSEFLEHTSEENHNIYQRSLAMIRSLYNRLTR